MHSRLNSVIELTKTTASLLTNLKCRSSPTSVWEPMDFVTLTKCTNFGRVDKRTLISKMKATRNRIGQKGYNVKVGRLLLLAEASWDRFTFGQKFQFSLSMVDLENKADP